MHLNFVLEMDIRESKGVEARNLDIEKEQMSSQFIVTPNCSMSWRANKLFVTSLAVVSFGIAGLFAAGQAMGGLFGANRLGSTSLTEGAVFGARAGIAAAKSARLSSGQVDQAHFAPLIDDVKARFGQSGTLYEDSRLVWYNEGLAEYLVGSTRTGQRPVASSSRCRRSWTGSSA